jgi:ABC-type transporter Mla subunit MlaD
MQLTPAQKTRLGIFVSIGLLIVMGSFAAIMGLNSFKQTHEYLVRFHDSVSGLDIHSPVKYQGLKVGQIKEMHICAEDQSAIEIVLSVQPELSLYDGTIAVLDMSGLTGIKVINLIPGDMHGKKIKPGSILPSGPSIFDRLADNVSVIVGEVRRVTQQISSWVTPENRHRIENLIANLNRFVAHLDQLITETDKPIAKLVYELTRTTHHIGDTAQSLTHIIHNTEETIARVETVSVDAIHAITVVINALDGDVISNTITYIRDAAKTLSERLSVEEAGKAVAAFSSALDQVSRLIGDIDLVVRASREDFTSSLSYIRQAAEDLREFSRILAQNPSVLVRGRGEEQ